MNLKRLACNTSQETSQCMLQTCGGQTQAWAAEYLDTSGHFITSAVDSLACLRLLNKLFHHPDRLG